MEGVGVASFVASVTVGEGSLEDDGDDGDAAGEQAVESMSTIIRRIDMITEFWEQPRT
jgi:hypothetical protein